VLYFSPRHVRIENFDVSHNNLKKFQILSWTLVETKYPFGSGNQPTANSTKHATVNSSSSPAATGSKVVSGESDAASYEDYSDNDVDALNDHYYEDDEDYETVVSTHRKSDLDDDRRFVFIQVLDLSHNKFETVNVQHMLQSVQNVVVLDLSSNPIIQVVGNDPFFSFLRALFL
jgi:hypothetical protein